MAKNFYQYQRNRTLILIIWGATNTLIGMVGAVRSKNKFWRHFWLQALGWGAINALIGLAGVHSQTKKLATASSTPFPYKEKPQSSGLVKDIRNFHRILLINVVLDLGYVLSGEFIRRGGVKSDRLERQGIGVGFQFQGLYLFFYDLILALEVKQLWISRL